MEDWKTTWKNNKKAKIVVTCWEKKTKSHPIRIAEHVTFVTPAETSRHTHPKELVFFFSEKGECFPYIASYVYMLAYLWVFSLSLCCAIEKSGYFLFSNVFSGPLYGLTTQCASGGNNIRESHTHSPDLVLSGRRPTSSRLSPCNPKPIQITRAEVKKQNVRNTHTRSYGTRELIEKRNRNKF